MDKTERETRDLMSVESFSQLPFIRPAPAKEKPGGGAIRLFGKEFGAADEDDQSDPFNGQQQQGDQSNNNKDSSSDNNNNSVEIISSRKFECHYCCRNFPTSQALGGHQNAHKRERQHAKRAHLQSAMAHDYSSATTSSGLFSYNRPIGYWNTATTTTPYGGATARHHLYGHNQPPAQQQQPINGSPLAMWRIPTSSFSRERASSFLPRQHHHHHHQQSVINNNSPSSYDYHNHHNLKPLLSGVGSQSRLGYNESKGSGMQDPVSLDLHL